MQENEYNEAATEVLEILNHTDIEDVEKIPQSFINYLKEISDKNYRPQFNYEYPMEALNLQKQTKELLGFIYITWWATKEKREKYKKEIYLKNLEKERVKGKYNSDDIFKSRKYSSFTKKENVEETNMTDYKKRKELNGIFYKILRFLGIKK